MTVCGQHFVSKKGERGSDEPDSDTFGESASKILAFALFHELAPGSLSPNLCTSLEPSMLRGADIRRMQQRGPGV